MNIIKSYRNIFFTTLIHGCFTWIFLKGIPHISIKYFDILLLYSTMLWFLLSGIYYYTIQVFIFNKDDKWKQCIYAIVFGVIGTCLKAGMDFIQTEIALQFSAMSAPIFDQISTVIYGAIWMCFLFFVVGKQKYKGNWKRIKSPIIIIVIIFLIYTIFWINGFRVYQNGILDYPDITDAQISNLAYYYAPMFSWFNAPTYVAFYLVFWWLLRCCTLEEIVTNTKEIVNGTEDLE